MLTHEELEPFWEDLKRLTPAEREAFMTSVRRFVADLGRGQFRAGLRIKRVPGHPGIWELTWAPTGRATFEYDTARHPGEPSAEGVRRSAPLAPQR